MDSSIVPNEIWIDILGYLSKPDLKAVRVSGDPHLRPVASSLLFTTVYIAARQGVLDTFRNLATHRELSKCVKRVVYDNSYIDPATVAEHKDEGWKSGPALAKLFKEQEDILKNKFRPCLEDAFACLSNVRSVYYADMSRIACLPGDRNDPSWSCDYHDGPLTLCHESAVRHIERYHKSPEEGFAFSASMDDHYFRRQYGGFIFLMQSMSKHTSATLQELSLGDRVHAPGNHGILFQLLLHDTPESLFGDVETVFHSLRKLNLDISLNIFVKEDLTAFGLRSSRDTADPDLVNNVKDVRESEFATLLKAASNLEELKLSFEHSIPFLSFTKIFSKNTWSKLRLFHIRNFASSIQEVKEFLTRHSMTLRHVTIDHFKLTLGKWTDLKTVTTEMASEFELIFGLMPTESARKKIESEFTIVSKDFDKSGLKTVKRKRRANDEDEANDEDGDGVEDELIYAESDTESDTDSYLSYSSDDSSASTTGLAMVFTV